MVQLNWQTSPGAYKVPVHFLILKKHLAMIKYLGIKGGEKGKKKGIHFPVKKLITPVTEVLSIYRCVV